MQSFWRGQSLILSESPARGSSTIQIPVRALYILSRVEELIWSSILLDNERISQETGHKERMYIKALKAGIHFTKAVKVLFLARRPLQQYYMV